MNEFMTIKPTLTPGAIRRAIAHYDSIDNPWVISSKARGAITGAIARAIKSILITRPDQEVDPEEIDYYRHLVLGYLCLPDHKPLKPISSKTLSDGQWMGLSRWQSYKTNEVDFQGKSVYKERPTFADEVAHVLYRAKKDLLVGQGQLPIFGLISRWENEIPDNDHYDIDDFYNYVREETYKNRRSKISRILKDPKGV